MSSTVVQPDQVRPADAHGLEPVDARQSLAQYVKDLWSRREFVVAIPTMNLRAENMDTLLGNLWHLLNPALLVAVYYLIFGLLLGVDRGLDNFLAFLAIGVFAFQWTQKSTLSGAVAIIKNRGLIESIQFPRAVLPISATIERTIAFLPTLAVLAAVLLFTGEQPAWRWLAILPLVALQAVFNLGAAFVAARCTAVFRDMQNVLPFLFRLAFYASGILYPLSRYVSDEPLLRLASINPLYSFVSLQRAALLAEDWRVEWVVSTLAWTALLLVGGFLFFRRGETSYGRS